MDKEYKQPGFIVKEEGDLIIVKMHGDINQHTLPESRKMVDDLIKLHNIYRRENLRILVDYANVEHVDSAAIANLLERIEEHKNNFHRIAFINVPEEFIKLIEIYKLQETFTIFDSEEQAIKELQKKQ